jgi:hypothetical protein
MNSKTCRNTRQEIDELELGAQPSEPATAHLAICEPCREFRSERTELRELVGSLDPVDAPGDFEMRLRARIAADRPSRPQTFFARLISTPALAAAALFVIVAGTVVWLAQRQSSSPATTTGSVATVKTTGSVTQSNPSAPVENNASSTETGSDLAQQNGRSVRRTRQSTRAVRSEDFAVLPANSIRQSDANQAYVNAPSKPVVFSLEDARGTTRKISLPPVTFGAQNLVDNRTQVSYAGNSRVW